MSKLLAVLHRVQAVVATAEAPSTGGKHRIERAGAEYVLDLFTRLFGAEKTQEIVTGRSSHRTNGFLRVQMVTGRMA